MEKYIESAGHLKETNKELMEELTRCSINKLQLTSLGNSIATGFSICNKNQPLLMRNETIEDTAKAYQIELETHHFSRTENNSDEHVYNWFLENKLESSLNKENRRDYNIYTKRNNSLLTEIEKDQYFPTTLEFDRGIRDVILEKGDSLANLVIMNVGTGSWLDNCTRHGKHLLTSGIKKDQSYIEALLGTIQWNNRENLANTQVYLCGAPRILNTFLTDHFMNNPLKKKLVQYANVSYVPNFPRHLYYRTKEGYPLPEPHYNEYEYLHLLNEVEKTVVKDFEENNALIILDRILTKRSKEIEMNEQTVDTRDEVLSIIEQQANTIKEANKDHFLQKAQSYCIERYPHDFYYLDHRAIKDSAKLLTKTK